MFQRSSERRTDRVKKSCVRKVASLLAQPLRNSLGKVFSPARGCPEKSTLMYCMYHNVPSTLKNPFLAFYDPVLGTENPGLECLLVLIVFAPVSRPPSGPTLTFSTCCFVPTASFNAP